MPRQQIIKIKQADLDQAVVRGLSHSVWQSKRTRGVREQVHLSPKRRLPRHKKNFADPDAEF